MWWLVLAAATLTSTVSSTEITINSGRNGESTSQTSLLLSTTTKTTTTTTALDSGSTEAPPPPSRDDAADLDNAETKDPSKKLDIIKQIRKINKDGSYTVGYEAGDGTFKIESRDVLGNVKGTYGYVDANGEIKRVSYTGQNGTSAIQNYPSEVVDKQQHQPQQQQQLEEEEKEITTQAPNANTIRNRSYPGPTRRPASLKFLSTTPSSSYGAGKSSVIQTIPRRRIAVPSSTARSLYSHYATSKLSDPSNEIEQPTSTRSPVTSSAPEDQTPTTIVYARTVPTQKSMFVIRPTTQSSSVAGRTPEQIGRPDKLEINHVSKVMVMKSSDTTTSKSVTGKEQERKSIRGNNLRRQLTQEREDHYEAQPQHLYSQAAGEDSAHIFDGSTGNLRPLYSTSSRPRVPSIVLAARQRAAQLQNAISSSSPTTTTEKVYVRPPPSAASVQYETTTEPVQESNYLTQRPGPVLQIPAQQASEDERTVYRQRPTPFSLRPSSQSQLGQPPPQLAHQYQGTEQPRNLYGPGPLVRGNGRQREDDDDSNYGRNGNAQQGNNQQGSFPVPFQQQPFGGPQFPGGGYPGYGGGIGGGGGPYGMPFGRPYTSNDFERLLQLLVLRHQGGRGYGGYGGFGGGGFGGGAGGFGGIGGIGGGAGFGGGYNPYYGSNPGIAPYLSNPYQGLQQYPRSQLYDPVGFDPRYAHTNRFGGFRQYSEPEGNVFPNQAQQSSGDPQQLQVQQPQQQHQQQLPYDGQRVVPRQRQFNPSYFGANSSPVVNPYRQQAAAAPQQYPDYAAGQYSQQVPTSQQQQQQQPEYLPSDVREDLLYRMLMLAIQGEGRGGGIGGGAGLGGGGFDHNQLPITGYASDPIKSIIPVGSATPKPFTLAPGAGGGTATASTRKPVRSVQILGEE